MSDALLWLALIVVIIIGFAAHFALMFGPTWLMRRSEKKATPETEPEDDHHWGPWGWEEDV